MRSNPPQDRAKTAHVRIARPLDAFCGFQQPNAGAHLLPEAGAQRTLEAVRCSALFGVLVGPDPYGASHPTISKACYSTSTRLSAISSSTLGGGPGELGRLDRLIVRSNRKVFGSISPCSHTLSVSSHASLSISPSVYHCLSGMTTLFSGGRSSPGKRQSSQSGPPNPSRR